MKSQGIPLIKERRFELLVDSLKCPNDNKYERTRQIDCVLQVYNKKTREYEKSIFRGIVIPTLGKLGLIVNYGRMVKPSENGHLLIIARELGEELYKAAKTQVIIDIDREMFGFMEVINGTGPNSKDVLLRLMDLSPPTSSEKQKRERVRNWLKILSANNLIIDSEDFITLNSETIWKCDSQSSKIVNMYAELKGEILKGYSVLADRTYGIVDIEELRIITSESCLKKYKLIVTRKVFDQILGKVIKNETRLKITLGHSMGKGEKLFKLDGEYYRTIHIKG
jgi:hypothetical protein